MSSIVITQQQLDRVSEDLKREELIKSIHEKWEKCSVEQRVFVLEFLKAVNPQKKKQIQEVIKKVKSNNINEAWYNTVLDLVGWVDPTGIADALNGVIYLTQGEYLFGFLSFVGAIPYAGDIVAKPIMYALKLGKPSAKALNGVMKLSKAGKFDEAAQELARLSSGGGIVGTFVNGMRKLAPKLEEFIKAIPAGPLKGFKNTLLEWVQLFKGAGSRAVKSAAPAKAQLGSMAKSYEKLIGKGMDSMEQKRLEALLSQEISSAKRGWKERITNPFRAPDVFSGYRTTNKLLTWKNFWGGMPQIMGRNKSVRALMRKTKWYLGLLDFLGIANFVGPDELATQMGDAKFEQSIGEYNQTPQAKSFFEQDFGGVASQSQDAQPTAQTQTQSQPQAQTGLDPLSWLLQSSLATR
jgi:hypothetical protein